MIAIYRDFMRCRGAQAPPLRRLLCGRLRLRRAPGNSPKLRWLILAAVLLPVIPTLAQSIPGSAGWLLVPMQGQARAPQRPSKLDIALIRCYRTAIATGQFFLGDVNYVLARCEQPLAAWVNDCERREGRGAPICLLGPQQAVGDALRDAWAHRNDLKSWLASLPPLPDVASGHD